MMATSRSIVQDLNKTLEEHIFVKEPRDRIKNEVAVPFTVISTPLFDHNNFPEDAWEGIKCLIEEDLKDAQQYFNHHPYHLIIAGNLVGVTYFNHTKNELPRLNEVDPRGLPLNQENFNIHWHKMLIAADHIAGLPEGVKPFYAAGEFDQMQIKELYSELVQIFDDSVSDIYNVVKNLPTYIDNVISRLRDLEETYEVRQNNAYKSYLDERTTANSKYERISDSLQAKMDAARDEMNLDQDSKFNAEQTIEDYIAHIDELNSNISSLEKQVEEKQPEKDELNLKIGEIIWSMDEKEQLYKDILNKISDEGTSPEYRAERDSLAEELKNYRVELRTYKKQIDDINFSLKPIHNQIIQYQKQVTQEEKNKLKTEKTLERLVRKIEKNQTIIANASEAMQNEEIRHEENKRAADKSYKTTKQAELENYNTKIRQFLSNTRNSFNGRKQTIERIATELHDKFFIPAMPEMMEDFNKFTRPLSNLALYLRNPIVRIDNSHLGYEFRLSHIEPELIARSAEFETKIRDMKNKYSVSVRDARIAKRRIPLQWRLQLGELAHYLHFDVFLPVALRGGPEGDRDFEIRKGYNNNLRLYEKDGTPITLKVNGMGTTKVKDAVRSARHSIASGLLRQAQSTQNAMSREFIPELEYVVQQNDPDLLEEQSASNKLVDIIIRGPFKHAGVAPVTNLNNPHITYVIEVPPLSPVSESLYNNLPGAKTQTQKMAKKGYSSGAVVADYGKRIMHGQLFNLEKLERFYKQSNTIKVLHNGDTHKGAREHNAMAHAGLLYIAANDPYLLAYIHTGDGIENEMSYRYDRRHQTDANLTIPENQALAFVAGEQQVLKNVAKNNSGNPKGLRTFGWYSLGQHDNGRGGIDFINFWLTTDKTNNFSFDEMMTMPDMLRQREQGYDNRLSQQNWPVEPLNFGYNGHGKATFAYKDNPEHTFARAIVAHRYGDSRKSQPWDIATDAMWQSRKHGENVEFIFIGDKHKPLFMLSDDTYVTRTAATLVDQNRDDKLAQINPYMKNWSLHSPIAYPIVHIPTEQHAAASVTFIPPYLLNQVFESELKPKLLEMMKNRNENYAIGQMMR